jgi:hypothetical protein
MTTVELKTAPELKRVILAAFPSYKKHRTFLSAFNGGVNINTYWDGGSRSEFAIVDLNTWQRKALPTATHPYFDVARKGIAGQEDSVIAVSAVGNVTLKVLPEGFALVEAGTFCGKAATAHVYLNAANMAKLLPAVQGVL